ESPPWALHARPPGPPALLLKIGLLCPATLASLRRPRQLYRRALPRRRIRAQSIGMQLTHFGHSCLLAEFGDTRLLFDPGTFAHGFEGLTGLSAVVITHQHPDHIDVTRLPSLLDGNPNAALYADSQTAEQL